MEEFSCFIKAPIKSNYSYSETISAGGIYHVFVSNCHDPSQSVKYNYNIIMLNPGGEQLGTGDIPLPTLYTVFICVWSLLCLLWLINWIQFRVTKILLHRIITIQPFLKVIVLLYNIIYWRSLSQYGQINYWVNVMYYVLSMSWEALLFMSLLLISKGWSITRQDISNQELNAMLVSIFSLAFSYLLYKLIGGYYLFALVVIYIVLLKYMLSNIAYNLNSLKSQLLLIRQQRIDASSTVVFYKFQLFRAFQTIMITWTFVQALIVVVVIFFLTNVPWVEAFLNEFVELFLFLGEG